MQYLDLLSFINKYSHFVTYMVKVGPRCTFITDLYFRKAGGKDVLVSG